MNNESMDQTPRFRFVFKEDGKRVKQIILEPEGKEFDYSSGLLCIDRDELAPISTCGLTAEFDIQPTGTDCPQKYFIHLYESSKGIDGQTTQEQDIWVSFSILEFREVDKWSDDFRRYLLRLQVKQDIINSLFRNGKRNILDPAELEDNELRNYRPVASLSYSILGGCFDTFGEEMAQAEDTINYVEGITDKIMSNIGEMIQSEIESVKNEWETS